MVNATDAAPERPSALKALQRRMAAAVMEPLTRSETMARRRRDGLGADIEAEAFVKPNDRLTSFERLEIYNRQYWFRLYASFEEDFPGLQAIVGRAKFESIMRQYLSDCPSTSFTLRNLGSRLEQWLGERPELTAPRSALALDMARIEWAHIEAFDGAALAPLSTEDLAQIDGGSRLRLQPHLQLLRLHYPVDDLLIAVRHEAGSGDASSNNAMVARRSKVVRKVADLAPEEISLAVHRQDNIVYYKRLHGEDHRMLEVLRSGDTLEAAIAAAFEGSKIPEEEQPAFLSGAFQTWAQLGWFGKPTKESENE